MLNPSRVLREIEVIQKKRSIYDESPSHRGKKANVRGAPDGISANPPHGAPPCMPRSALELKRPFTATWPFSFPRRQVNGGEGVILRLDTVRFGDIRIIFRFMSLNNWTVSRNAATAKEALHLTSRWRQRSTAPFRVAWGRCSVRVG